MVSESTIVIESEARHAVCNESNLRTLARSSSALDRVEDTPWRRSPIPGVQVRPWAHVSRMPARHSLSVDVEDWPQSVLDGRLPVSDRFITQTLRLAELIELRGARATFFMLGNVARKAPELARRLARSGHEIQTHGYDHRRVDRMTPAEFRADLLRSREIIEDVIGREVSGYRAPRFSIHAGNPWALDVLAECGFRYDSSIFPTRIRGYGVAGWPQRAHQVRTFDGAELIEIPVACGRMLGAPMPLGGGGYLRVLPVFIVRRHLAVQEALGCPELLYCHPYETDAYGVSRAGRHVSWLTRVHQGAGRAGFLNKLDELLTRFRFAPIREAFGINKR
ncbi:MAG: polysaccharide deacetylase [Planctomycetota bacterium]|nr:MAG: polysaccharide deacetylase [Planctomycetota bacterium]